ncbi:hypothetical protein CR513_08157, partial [Mucuna pruriens]
EVTYATESCLFYSTSMGWCIELPQPTTPRQMAKPKYSIGKSRKHYKRLPIPTRKTGADSLRTLHGHTELHTELCWECLPTGLFLNIELTRLSSNATWPMTKLKNKGSSSCKNWTNFAWKHMRTLGSISRRSSNFMINRS